MPAKHFLIVGDQLLTVIGSICMPNYHCRLIYCYYRIGNWQDTRKVLKTFVIFRIVANALRHPLDKRGQPTIFARFNASTVIIRHVHIHLSHIAISIGLLWSREWSLTVVRRVQFTLDNDYTDSHIVESLSRHAKIIIIMHYTILISCFVIHTSSSSSCGVLTARLVVE